MLRRKLTLHSNFESEDSLVVLVGNAPRLSSRLSTTAKSTNVIVGLLQRLRG